MAPPAAFGEGLIGFTNPANLALLHKPEVRFIWSTDGSDANHWASYAMVAMLTPKSIVKLSPFCRVIAEP